MDRFLVGMFFGALIMGALHLLSEFLRLMFPWRRALLSGGKASFLSLILMRARGYPPAFIVDAFCALVHTGHDITIRQVESCYAANKHRISEDNMAEFIEMAKEFSRQHPVESESTMK